MLPKWLMALLVMLQEMWSTRRDAHIRFLKLQVEILKERLPGNRVILDPVERRRLMKIGAEVDHTVEHTLGIVTINTYRRWQREARGGREPSKVGRPRLTKSLRKLIIRLAKENGGWGVRRIVGELKKLALRASRSSVRRVLVDEKILPDPDRRAPAGVQTPWRKFIAIHLNVMVACDFFCKTVWTPLGKHVAYVLTFVHLGSRKVFVSPSTLNPTDEWMRQQARNASMWADEEGIDVRFLIHDRDTKFTGAFDEHFRRNDGGPVLTPYGAPIANCFAESWIGHLKRECLNLLFCLSLRQLDHIVQIYAQYHNEFRPHQAMGNRPLGEGQEPPPQAVSPRIIRSRLWHKDLRQVAFGGFFCYQRRMNTVIDLVRNLWNALGCVAELLGYLLRFVSVFFQSRVSLAGRLLAAESQLGMCKRRVDQKSQPKPMFTAGFRLLWVILSKLWAPWQAAAQLMQPATVKKWHTRAFRLYWRRKSRRKAGRLPISQEMRDLIRQLSRENPLWGAGQIRDNLLLLHYAPPCEDTIRKYMVKPKNSRGKSTTWLPFLRNHLDVSWAIDFFTVNTIRLATLYVFIVLDHGRRNVVYLAITCNPSMRWVIQQLREAMPYGQQPRFLLRDNDGIYGNGVGKFLDSCDIEEARTAYRCPWQNPFVERFVGTLRRELLDHVIVLGQGHLERLLREFIEDYYHVARPHQGLDGDTPIPQPESDAPITGPTKLISTPILGGLHHRYQRVGA